jgi:hypothetical protein
MKGDPLGDPAMAGGTRASGYLNQLQHKALLSEIVASLQRGNEEPESHASRHRSGGRGRHYFARLALRHLQLCRCHAAVGVGGLVPYLRAYGTTRFLSSETFRNAIAIFASLAAVFGAYAAIVKWVLHLELLRLESGLL